MPSCSRAGGLGEAMQENIRERSWQDLSRGRGIVAGKEAAYHGRAQDEGEHRPWRQSFVFQAIAAIADLRIMGLVGEIQGLF